MVLFANVGMELHHNYLTHWAFLVSQTVKNLPAMQETRIQSLDWEDLLENGMSTHSIILTCRIPWTEEPVGLQSMGSQKVRLKQLSTHAHAHTIHFAVQ